VMWTSFVNVTHPGRILQNQPQQHHLSINNNINSAHLKMRINLHNRFFQSSAVRNKNIRGANNFSIQKSTFSQTRYLFTTRLIEPQWLLKITKRFPLSNLQTRTFATSSSSSDDELTLEGDELRDLTPYELSRILLSVRISGVLSTFTSSVMNNSVVEESKGDSNEDPQKIEPVTSYLIPYVLKGHNPIIALFPNEKHSKNISSYNNVSLTVSLNAVVE
jgi:hypothetical protein